MSEIGLATIQKKIGEQNKTNFDWKFKNAWISKTMNFSFDVISKISNVNLKNDSMSTFMWIKDDTF